MEPTTANNSNATPKKRVRCSSCRRTMVGLKIRCKHCGWVDGTKVVYVFLAAALAGVMCFAVYYVKTQGGSGGDPTFMFKSIGQDKYGHVK